MRRLGFFLAVAVVTAAMIALVAASAMAQSLTGLDANLTGKAEVLGAGDSSGDKDGSGTAYVTLIPSQSRLCYSLEVSDIAPATKARIHQGASKQAGPTIVELDPPTQEEGTSSGCTGVNTALLRSLLERPQDYYVEVYNKDYPDGALRGQLSETEGSSFRVPNPDKSS